MSQQKKDSLKWGNIEIIRFLNAYRKYEELWDTNNSNFLKKNAKEGAFIKLYNDLIELGFKIETLEQLKRKIKNIKDTYRSEVNKIKKSMKSGAGAEDIYNTHLVWFNEASFLRNVMSGRESSSNLNLSQNECLPVAEEVSDCNLDYENQSTESTVATTVNERVSEALCNKKAAVMKNAGPPKKKQSKIYSNFQESVSQLRNIVDSTVDKEDEYDRFALHIAAQLRKLPERSFVILQDQIQSLITKERLKSMTYSHSSPEGTSRSSYYSYRGTLPSTPSPQATYQPTATLLGQEGFRSTPSPHQPTYEIQETSHDYFEQHANILDQQAQQEVLPQEQATNGDMLLQRAIESIFPSQ